MGAHAHENQSISFFCAKAFTFMCTHITWSLFTWMCDIYFCTILPELDVWKKHKLMYECGIYTLTWALTFNVVHSHRSGNDLLLVIAQNVAHNHIYELTQIIYFFILRSCNSNKKWKTDKMMYTVPIAIYHYQSWDFSLLLTCLFAESILLPDNLFYQRRTM